MRGHPPGRDATLIDAVAENPDGVVQMGTAFGGQRIVDWLAGDQLPMIC